MTNPTRTVLRCALAALIVLASGCSGSGPSAQGGSQTASLAWALERDALVLPAGATHVGFKVLGPDDQNDFYLTFRVSPEAFRQFLTSSAISPAPDPHSPGLQHDLAAKMAWPIADVPYFAPGTVGCTGDRPGVRSFEMTADERDQAQFVVYLYTTMS